MKRRALSLAMPGSKGGVRAAAIMRATARDDKRRFSVTFLIMIVALLFQSLITGSHIHADALFGRTGNPDLSANPGISRQSPPKSDECVICQEIAQAGQYVAPAPPHVLAGVLQSFWLSPAVVRPAVRHTASHTWHSRGPPPATPL